MQQIRLDTDYKKDFANTIMKYFVNDFINNIQNESYNKIRKSQSDAQCRKILKELLKKYEI